jgi:MoaA/NifB/PqqE/SkfB family radical SAM enzyme
MIMWFYKVKKSKAPDTHHKDCPSCEYRKECFWVLRWSHALLHNCLQGRKSAVRVKAKDQVTLDEVKPV